jgi:hypothetical protein
MLPSAASAMSPVAHPGGLDFVFLPKLGDS